MVTGPLLLVGGEAEDRTSRRDTPSGGKDAGAETYFSRYGVAMAFTKPLPGGVAATAYGEMQEYFGRSKGHGVWNITDVHGGVRIHLAWGGRLSPYLAADLGYAHWEGQRGIRGDAPSDHGGITFGVRTGIEVLTHWRASIAPEISFRSFDATTGDFDARWIGFGIVARFHLW
jgi:hypothetical protein